MQITQLPAKIIKDAIAAVPAVKYALGVSGIAAAIAIIAGFIDLKRAFIGVPVMFVFMVSLLVFGALAKSGPEILRLPALIFCWFFLFMIMAISTVLFLSFAFDVPRPLAQLLGAMRVSTSSDLSISSSEYTRDMQDRLAILPSRDVEVSAGDDVNLQRLRKAATCLKEGKEDCVLVHVEKVLQYTVGATQDIEARAQALAIRAISHLHAAAWQLAQADYEEALKIHFQDDGHKDQWLLGLAAAYANRAAELQAVRQNSQAAALWEKAWSTARASSSRETPTSVSYADGWQSFRAVGYTRATVEVKGNEQGLTLECDNGQRIEMKYLGSVDPKDRPVLSWSWLAEKIPERGDVRTTESADQGLQVLVAFHNFKVLHYVWDGQAPVGWRGKRPDVGLPPLELLNIVVESGASNIGKLLSYKRDIVEDYTSFFADQSPNSVPLIAGVALQTECNDTHSTASGWVSPLYFAPRSSGL